MKLKSALVVLAMMFVTIGAVAQGVISGRVYDGKTGSPIEYATVAVLDIGDSSLITGTVSQSNGEFAVKVGFGKYLVRISFMGYATYFHPVPVSVSKEHGTFKMGKVKISPSATTMAEVSVVAERTMVEYQLDKRVVNVDKSIVTGGGTATDVLENVPSVAIDNDGNVTLRGSTNVKVLIDGRPYELLGSDLESLLEQIPASTVENVEIITNPSAKFDPEGMSGIINVKLKEKASGSLGLNGVVNVNAGAPLPFMIRAENPKFFPTTMGTVNLNYATEKYNLFFSADGGMRSRASQGTNYIERRHNGLPESRDSLYQFGANSNYMGSVKIGGEYYFDKQNSLLLSYQFRRGLRRRVGSTHSEDIFTSDGQLSYDQTDTNNTNNYNHTVSMLYSHKFDEPDHLFTFDAAYTRRGGFGDVWQQQYYPVNFEKFNIRETEFLRAAHRANIRMNYACPVFDRFKLEAGYESQMTWNKQDYDYYRSRYEDGGLRRTYDSISSLDYRFGQQVHAIYATLGGQISDAFSAQVGLRGEYSNINGADLVHDESYEIDKDYYQLYPTLHLSYDICTNQSVQVSYSRRVRRPHMWDLHPYINVSDGKEMSFGNPGLAPEFTNAFEVSYNLALDKVNIFTSAYFRQTDSMMTRYGFVWDSCSAAYYSPWMVYNDVYDGYWASTWQNLSKGINAGLELIVDWQILKWWKANISINLYDSYVEGTELLDNTGRNAFRAGGKFSSYMSLPQDWTVQFSGQYRAPFMDLQTDMMASYWFDVAVKKDVLDHRGTVNFRVGDLFCTGGFGHDTENAQLHRVMRSRRISPVVTVGFTYKINNGMRQNNSRIVVDDESSDGGEY